MLQSGETVKLNEIHFRKMEKVNNENELENRKIQVQVNGIGRSIPALHAESMIRREWVTFIGPPDPEKELKVPGAKELWLDRCDLVLDDLKFLLKSPYHVFWSQIRFDCDLHASLGRLLKRLPRFHDKYAVYPDEEIHDHITQVCSYSFHVFLRMSTRKETLNDYMSIEFFSEMIYNNFLLDIPKIFDICSIFYDGNQKLLAKMIENLFSSQPKYFDDLKLCSKSIMESVSTLSIKIEEYLQSRQSLATNEFEDLIMYATDLILSLTSLIECYPKATEVFFKHSPDFTLKLSYLYQHGLVDTENKIFEERMSENINFPQAEYLQSRLLLSRTKLVLIVRSTINHNLLKGVIEGTTNGEHELEEYLNLYNGFLSDITFFEDYTNSYHIDDDIQIFKLRGLEIDTMRIEYLKDGLFQQRSEKKTTKKTIPEPKQNPVANSTLEEEKSFDQSIKIQSLVANVRDLFPQLGTGFLAKCLPYFDNNPENVINALLEDNLPPHLANLDRTMEFTENEPAKIQEKPVEHKREEESNDHFHGMELSKLHRGKKSKAKNANALLEDKSDLSGLKDKFSALGIVKDEILVSINDIEYDDEYDDTYDENAIGEAEPDAHELEREFVLPRALGGGHINRRNKKADGDSEESDEDEANEKNPNLNFARNPQEIREEAERRRQSKMKKPPNPHRDVVGKAKGQGQDKNVLINRSRKNQQKNKHHRNMADKKQSKGMF